MLPSKIESLRKKAKANPKTIVLPEGEDVRVVEAASEIAKEKIAKIILLGKKDNVNKLAKSKSISLNNVDVEDPESHPRFKEMCDLFYELRKHKGMTPDEARKFLLEDYVYVGALMTRLGMADGFVAGASHTTSDVAKASIYCLHIDREVMIVSSSFLIELDHCDFGEHGLFIFADCGIIPDPKARQLAGIAISASELLYSLFGIEPKVAMLSYSTKGSAHGESVDKVIEALRIIKEAKPGMKADGEFQLDAAIVPEVAKIKAPESSVAGKANVLIFPNLDAGNISYKLMQRLGKARVVGPLLQGLTQPASDLSRGCEIEEIMDAVTVTAIRAQKIHPHTN